MAMAMINDERGPFRYLKWREIENGTEERSKKNKKLLCS